MANVSSFSGAMPVIPGGEVEIARVTRTNGSGGIGSLGTTWGTGSNFFSTSLTLVSDGASTYALEFYAPLAYSPSVAQQLAIRVSESDGTSDGGIISFAGNAAAEGQSVFSRVFVTPSAGTATYNVRFSANTGTGQIYCGVGGAGAYVPAYLRAVKIVNQNDGLKPVWTPPIVTQLPAQATFGDSVLFAADATNGVYWHLSYDGLGTYPWKFIGGAPFHSDLAASTTASAGAPASGGSPSVAIALPGSYVTRYGCLATPGAVVAGHYCAIQPAFAGAVISIDHELGFSGVGSYFPMTGERAITFASAGTLSLFYRSDAAAGTSSFIRRYINATPIRVKAA